MTCIKGNLSKESNHEDHLEDQLEDQLEEQHVESVLGRAGNTLKRKLPCPAEDMEASTAAKTRRYSAGDAVTCVTTPSSVTKRRAVSECGFEPRTKKQRGETRPLNTPRTPATKRTCPLSSPSTDCCPEGKRLKVEAESLSLSLPKSNGVTETSVKSFSLPKKSVKGTSDIESDIDSESPDNVEAALRALGVRVLGRQEVRAMTGVRCEVLGEGAFGSCIKTQHLDTGAPLVIKTLYRGDLRAVLEEASNLHHLQVEGVQRLVGVCVQDAQIVSHFAGEALDQYFYGRQVPLHDAAAVFVQVCRALQRVVSLGYIHADLHAGNVCVLQGSRGPVATLIDLGLACPLGPHAHEDEDVHSLAQMMESLLEPDRLCQHHPLVGDLITWIDAATFCKPHCKPQPHQSLEALEHVLTAILEHTEHLVLYTEQNHDHTPQNKDSVCSMFTVVLENE